VDNFVQAQTRVQPHGRSKDDAMDFATFYKVLHNIWEKAHPDIQIYHSGEEHLGIDFPCITIGVFNEISAKGYPKPRMIDVIPGTTGATGSGNDLIQWLQIFELIIRVDMFSTRESGGAEVAELICETFKKFMQEYSPVLEAKGLGEIRFFKRFTDEPVVRLGETIAVKRSLAYLTNMQWVTWTTSKHLESVTVEARTDEESYEEVEITVTE